MSGQVLITGATGKTGRCLLAQLQKEGVPCRVASRHGEPPFDWAQPSTWDAAVEDVASVYLVAPMAVDDPYSRMVEFLKLATRKGVRRFVLLSMASLPAGGPAHGQVHQWLMDNTADWAVLCPSAFMQNFSEGPSVQSIREEDTIYSNTRDGRVSFIDVADIAGAARAALMAPAALNDAFTLTGDEAITYDRVAELIGEACGRSITHTKISMDEMAERLMRRGLPEPTARLLAGGYEFIAMGGAAQTTDTVKTLTGRPPTTFGAFAKANVGAWRPK
ncbi:MAG TPA: hypothetical protein VGG48_18970 [Rhizomicrobium sp.]|jgi:uncharacterized protein YbjT (DUF2867 family)